jgi:hypothetical protein
MSQIHKMVLVIGIICLFFHGAVRGAQVLLNSDFGKCPVKIEHEMAGKFKGVLPNRWGDNYIGWNKSNVESHVIAEKGRKFLRFNLKYIDPAAGNPQFCTGFPGLVDGGFYRITLLARNNSTGPLSVGLRMGPAPYSFRYERQLGRSPEWVEKSWFFKLGCKADDSLGFYLVPCGAGTVDIALIRVEKLTSPAEVAAALPRPGRETKNFFRNSRLPLGLQAGWSLHRMSDKTTAVPDPKCIGPSGSPALRLEANGQMESFTGEKAAFFFCEPFQVADPFVKNRVALSFKGTGKWSTSCGGAGKKIDPTGEWKRASIEFTPNFAQKSYTLEISGDGTGTLWIDAFRAWSGDTDDSYKSAGECEVALGLPATEISETRIQFAEEPAELVYAVTGNFKEGVLKAKVANVYGREKNLPDLRLEPSNASGRIHFGVFPETPYGQFRTEVWVERNGKRISPMNEMVVTRVKKPVYWGKDAPESPFGGHFFSVDRTIKIMKAGGVNWARLHDAGFEYIGWGWLEPEKGKWKFRDEYIQRYRANHIKIFGQLGTTPNWANCLSKVKDGSKNPSFSDLYSSHFNPPLNLDEFANYVKTVTARYKGVIDEYFVWNEPWGEGFWGPADYDEAGKKFIMSKNPQADYAALMKAAYTAVKSVDPTIKVSGFNSCAWVTGRDWTKGVYDAGGMAWCDMIDYHFYTTTPQGFVGSHTDETYNHAVGYIREKEGRLDKPVYMSEGQGRPGTCNNENLTEPPVLSGIYKYALPYDPGEDPIRRADLMCKYVVNLLANNVAKVFLYSAHCYGSLGTPSEFNVLLCTDGYPHPSLAAHANMAQHLEGRKFFKVVNVAEGVYAYLFAGKDRSVAAISGRPGCAKYQLPAAKMLEVSDLFGNPLPARTAYTGTLIFAEAAMSPEALEKLVTGK